jgi:hypothetical protein
MKSFLIAIALGLGVMAVPAFAADAASAPMTKQQNKMTTCNATAGDKKGDDRKAFMKNCLSADSKPTQQDKMKTCNAEAAGKKGDDRKAFMKTCLSA